MSTIIDTIYYMMYDVTNLIEECNHGNHKT